MSFWAAEAVGTLWLFGLCGLGAVVMDVLGSKKQGRTSEDSALVGTNGIWVRPVAKQSHSECSGMLAGSCRSPRGSTDSKLACVAEHFWGAAAKLASKAGQFGANWNLAFVDYSMKSLSAAPRESMI